MIKLYTGVDKTMDCIFCKIINGEIPSYKIYEDDMVIAFLDVNPKKNGHTLIVPKKHIVDFTGLDSETILHIHRVAKNITHLLEDKLKATGFCINANYLDTQEIKHFHLHIVPNTKEEIQPVEEVYNKIKQ